MIKILSQFRLTIRSKQVNSTIGLQKNVFIIPIEIFKISIS